MIALLLVLIALGVDALLVRRPQTAFEPWLRGAFGQLHARLWRGSAATHVALFAVLLALLLIGLYVLLGLAGRGWVWLADLAVLVYFFRPRALDREVDRYLEAGHAEDRRRCDERLRAGVCDGSAASEAGIVPVLATQALDRWFAPLFWFFLLGFAGLVFHRAISALARPPDGERGDLAALAMARHIGAVLDLIPAHLMVFALALAAHLDPVLEAWRSYRREVGHHVLRLGFVGAAFSRLCADVDAADDGFVDEAAMRAHPLLLARNLLGRVLLVWLALVALIELARLYR